MIDPGGPGLRPFRLRQGYGGQRASEQVGKKTAKVSGKGVVNASVKKNRRNGKLLIAFEMSEATLVSFAPVPSTGVYRTYYRFRGQL